jgi:WD40 repeat protein
LAKRWEPGGNSWRIGMTTESERSTVVSATSSPRLLKWLTCRAHIVSQIFLFLLVFVFSWWITPIQPYAKLNVRHTLATMNINPERVFLQFSPDSATVVTAATNSHDTKLGPFRVWDTTLGVERHALAADWEEIDSIGFSPDSRFLAANERNGNLKLWSVRTGQEVFVVAKPKTISRRPSYDFTPNSDYLAYWRNENDLTFRHIATNTEFGKVPGQVGSQMFSPDGTSFATFLPNTDSKIGHVWLWRYIPNQEPVLIKEHRVDSYTIGVAPDLKKFAFVRIKRGQDSPFEFSPTVPKPGANPVDSTEVVLCDMTTGEQSFSMTLDNSFADSFLSLSFEPEGQLLSAHGNGSAHANWGQQTVALWDIRSIPKAIGLFLQNAPVISPDGTWVATVPGHTGCRLFHPADNDEKIFDVAGNLRHDPIQWIGDPFCVLSPGGQLIAFRIRNMVGKEPSFNEWLPAWIVRLPSDAPGNEVQLWSLPSGDKLLDFPKASEVFFSPDGKTMATYHEGQFVKLWRIPLGKPVWTIFAWAVIGWSVTMLVFVVVVRLRKRVKVW